MTESESESGAESGVESESAPVDDGPVAGGARDGSSGPDTALGSARRRPAPSSALFAGILLLALTGLAAALGVTRSSPTAAGSDTAAATPAEQQALLAAARAEGAAITTLSWQTADADLNRILAGALPKSQLYDQFAAQRARLPSLLKQNHSVSRGTVLASGLSSVSGRKARVMVAVDADISGKSGTPTVKHYRMVFTMQRLGNRWLASDVGFAGAPQ